MSLHPSFPSRDDGPPKRTWAPAIPACGADTRNGRAFRFSVQTEDGQIHRFLLTRHGLAWLTMTFIAALSPRLETLAFWWFRRQARVSCQSVKSSGSPICDGSPNEGQAQ